MLPVIESTKALADYQLFVRFQDGVEGVVDLSHLAGKGIFHFLDHDENFKKAYVNPESGAVSWNDDLDIDTLSLYAQLKGHCSPFRHFSFEDVCYSNF